MPRAPLPHLGSSFVDAQGRPTRAFAIWLQSLSDSTSDGTGGDPALAAEIEALSRLLGSPDGTVAGIPTGFLPDTTRVLAGDGIAVFGQLKEGTVTVAADSTDAFADVMSRISLRF